MNTDKPTFAQCKAQEPSHPNFDVEELDVIYAQLSDSIRQQIDAEVSEALTRENYAYARPGSRTWLRIQREVLKAKLAESVTREEESGLGI